MSNYILIHGQFHEIPDDALMHWKYIKREKVNGKWKYFYDIGQNEKKKYEQAKKNYYGKVNQIKSVNAKNRNGIDVGSDGYSVANTKKKHALKDALKTAEYEYKATPLYKREVRSEKAKESVSKVKNWAKDKLGYDEKQAMETAKVNATVKKNKAIDVEGKNNKWKIKYTNFDPYTGEATKKPGYDKVEELADWQTKYYKDLAKEAEDKYIDAIESYKKTPLAKIEKMKDHIDSVKNLVNKTIDKLTKSEVPEPTISKPGTENVIKENVIKENKIYEDVIKEDKIYEDVIDANGNLVKKRKKR